MKIEEVLQQVSPIVLAAIKWRHQPCIATGHELHEAVKKYEEWNTQQIKEMTGEDTNDKGL